MEIKKGTLYIRCKLPFPFVSIHHELLELPSAVRIDYLGTRNCSKGLTYRATQCQVIKEL